MGEDRRRFAQLLGDGTEGGGPFEVDTSGMIDGEIAVEAVGESSRLYGPNSHHPDSGVLGPGD
jgi:hypothetical protein